MTDAVPGAPDPRQVQRATARHEPENLGSEWCRLIVATLVDSGVRQLVSSPGARSTPLLIAATDHHDLEVTPVIDERVASFFALGQARRSGRPVALLCTSGTAPAHYLPAILEARHSRAPLVALTADRPLELIDNGAPQAIDQSRLYGAAAGCVDLGHPDPDPRALAGVRRRVAQAVAASLSSTVLETAPGGGAAGPIQINVRLRKPLEPTERSRVEASPLAVELERRVQTLLERPVPRVWPPRSTPDREAMGELARRMLDSRRGLVVAGSALRRRDPAVRATLGRLLELSGFAFAPDFSSGLRDSELSPVAHLDLLLRCDDLRPSPPDLVLQIGRAPLSSSWPLWLQDARASSRVWVLDEARWSDPTSATEGLLLGDVGATLEGLAGELERRSAGGSDGPDVDSMAGRGADRETYRARWAELDAAARARLDRDVAPGAPGEWSEGAVVRSIVEALPDGALLGVGNSLPIRLVDLWGEERGQDLELFHQRGVNGIDGLVSGFAGAVVARERALPGVERPAPAVLLIGDVSLTHDLGGLAVLRRVTRTDVTIVVLDNRGGRIFEQLPHAAGRDEAHLAAWMTPPDIDFAAAARLWRYDHGAIDGRDGLESLVASLGSSGEGGSGGVPDASRGLTPDPEAPPKIRLVEVTLPPHGASEQMQRLVQPP